MTIWKTDESSGAWVVVAATGGDAWLPVDELIFETREHAEQWADEFNQSVEFAPFRLHVKRIGWLRPDRAEQAPDDPTFCTCGHPRTVHTRSGGDCIAYPGCECTAFVGTL